MRILVPIVALLIGGIFVLSMLQNAPQPPKADPAATSTLAEDPPPTPAEPSLVQQVAEAAAVVTAVVSDQAPVDLGPLHVVPATEAKTSAIGSLDPESDYQLEVILTGWGAGVYRIELTHYTVDVNSDELYTLQSFFEDPSRQGVYYYPFAARAIKVNGQTFTLSDQRWQLDPNMPGRYTLSLANDQNQPVVKLVRHYKVTQGKGAYQLLCQQRVLNLSTSPLQVVWEQYAQTDAAVDRSSYLGDRRMFITGYFDPDYEANRKIVYAQKGFVTRKEIVDQLAENRDLARRHAPLTDSAFWPNPNTPQNSELVWAAAVNRYFATVIYLPVDAASENQPAKAIALKGPNSLFTQVQPILIGSPPASRGDEDHSQILLSLTSKTINIEPGQEANLDLGIYAGPRLKEVLTTEPFETLALFKMLRYELGCTLCTFQWLAHGLLAFLRMLHNLVGDWGISIIVLVMCVRGILHPITKKSQISMAKMGKQMQSIQPELEKIKKKYPDDQQRYQQEQMKLFREKGINPANMLGCAPMLLQTPIWIALYAMLFYAIELRHQPAFYGLFQAISGGSWAFLADLSKPDNFIRFAGEGYSFKLIFINLHMTGINLLPLLMGVMFYFQQKLTTPPPANEQAAQQQKIMKFMTLLFPIFLYSAPSGLTLYILSSTTAGIIDSYFVRKHIKEQEAAGELFNAKPTKPGGIMERIQKSMAAKVASIEAQKKKSKNKK